MRIIHRLAIAVASLMLAGGATGAPAAPKVPDKIARQNTQVMQVKVLLASGRPAEALAAAKALLAAIEADLSTEKRAIYSGQTPQMVIANMMQAAARGRSAVDVGPAYGEALFYNGFLLTEVGRGDEAGTFLDRAVEASPSNPQYLCETAGWHSRHHDAQGGLALYQRCGTERVNADPATHTRWQAASLRGQGFALVELGRLDEAEARYRESLKVEPGNALAQRELDYIAGERLKRSKAMS